MRPAEASVLTEVVVSPPGCVPCSIATLPSLGLNPRLAKIPTGFFFTMNLSLWLCLTVCGFFSMEAIAQSE